MVLIRGFRLGERLALALQGLAHSSTEIASRSGYTNQIVYWPVRTSPLHMARNMPSELADS